jgi:putative FmdB family regulatory protein
MPIYEYSCAKCGTFEVTQRITEKPLRRCPTCKGKVSKLISNTSFQLKGSGWYVTDYAGKGGGSKKSESKDESSSSAAKTEPGKSESKSESKADSKPKTEATAA